MNDKIRAILEKINEEQTLETSKTEIKEEKVNVPSPIVEISKPAVSFKVVKETPVRATPEKKMVEKKAKTVKKSLNTEGGVEAKNIAPTSQKEITPTVNVINEAEINENPKAKTQNPPTGFLANMVNEAFSYEKRKYAFVEPRLFELFMQIKIRKDIKNISVIVNSILNEYVEKHQEEIKKILERKF